jgi:hypothetical protein
LACRPTTKVCFGCLKQFKEDDAEYCHNCTEWKCPHCGICGCLVEEETLRAIRAIVKTYELYLEKPSNYYLTAALKHQENTFREIAQDYCNGKSHDIGDVVGVLIQTATDIVADNYYNDSEWLREIVDHAVFNRG